MSESVHILAKCAQTDYLKNENKKHLFFQVCFADL